MGELFLLGVHPRIGPEEEVIENHLMNSLSEIYKTSLHSMNPTDGPGQPSDTGGQMVD